jgi:hypothetical protein
MIFRLRPGTSRETALRALEDVATKLGNVRGGGGTTGTRYQEYIRWANDSTRSLRWLVTPADLERLVLTKFYWLLLPGVTGGAI